VPITYRLLADENMILEDWSGVISAAELGDYWRRLVADPAAMGCRRSLADLRRATIAVDGNQLREHVESILVPALGSLTWKSAILVAEPAQFGKARQYGAFANLYSDDQIFTDRAAATAWLKDDAGQSPSEG
jgi:hypothetical protein